MNPPPPQRPSPPKRISLVAQTLETLRAGILSGHWSHELPGEHRLCADLQVGRSTLRGALQELERMNWLKSATGRRRIINHKFTDQQPSQHPDQVILLAPRRTPDMPVGALVVMALLHDMLIKAGYEVQSRVSGPCFSSKPGRAMTELTRAYPTAKWVLIGSKAPLQQWMIKHGKSCFITGSCDPAVGLPSIDLDFQSVCRHAVGVLRRKGHSHIALVQPQNAYGGDIDSERAFLETIHQPGNGVRHTVLCHDRTAAHLSGTLDAALRDPAPPTAFLVAYPTHAITVITHLMKQGKRIPRDAAIISRDGDRYLEAIVPKVAHYRLDEEKFARRAAAAVRKWIEGAPHAPRTIRLMPEFITGETV